MIQKIASLSQSIQKLSQHQEINNTLPVLIHVLQKQSKDLYQIKIGNLITQTKSQKELMIGAKYLATLQKNPTGTLILSHLWLYPKALESLQNAPLKFSINDLKELLKNPEKFHEEWKSFLVEKFAHAPSKQEFLFFGNMLLSLQKNITSLVIDQDGKNHILQIKKMPQQSLEFYALYPNLGAISGLVYKSQGGVGLNLNVPFANVKNLLEKHLDTLHFFAQKQITLTPNIPPLFSFEDNLLDLWS
ncbi:hypothetical protein [Helicobacter mustelae]|uniref:Uncharacterized protein n=1 Tax=Helicobacter mustelae (strain ATCC 43772 / CCUG 25715 / CIP 103759 / LMG 18044 / NCTC 12198 / R85-136P) TaxID=679897 RepID=D3UJ75_HELM1|nr:hypothetical protein [Helicobacter mustelae]CBG40550.1 Putative hypothetical protein [Helicobacter mustelae 12198]SQH72048.1 Uncharacterised protein [Helicobacter mustelae]